MNDRSRNRLSGLESLSLQSFVFVGLEKRREVLILPVRDGRVDLTALMENLAEREVISLLLEGGGQLNASMLEAGLVDRLHVVIAPMLIGGREASTLLDGLGAGSIKEAWRLKDLRIEEVEGDLHVEASVVKRR